LKIITPLELNEILEANKTDSNPKGYEGAIAYVDVADAGKDYTALAIAIVIKNELYVVDYLYSRSNTDYTAPLIASKLDLWGVNYCRVESNNVGAMYGRGLQRLTKTKILLVANTTNKETRILLQSAEIMRKITFVKYEENAESVQFLQNVISYSKEGKNKNDDAPDCLAGLSLFSSSLLKI
jgi:predicted phage terminase large subunit-like protein